MSKQRSMVARVEAADPAASELGIGNYRLGAALLVMGAVVIAIQLDAWLISVLQSLPRFVSDAVNRLEPFGHGFGGVVVIGTAALVARLSYRQTGLLALSSFGSGMTANVLKVLVVRRRPGALLPGEFPELPRLSFVSNGDLPEFTERLSSSSLQSFPSAHTAAAFGLAVGLGALFPRARLWWLLLAAGCGLQRVMASRHFTSDVFIGAGIGLIVGSMVVRKTAAWTGQGSQTADDVPLLSVVSEVTERQRVA